MDRESQQPDRHECRQNCYPEDLTKITAEGQHQQDGAQRTNKGSNCIEALPKTITRATDFLRDKVRDHCVSGSLAHTFASSIQKARSKHGAEGIRNWEERLCQSGHAVSGEGQRFSFAGPVAKGA